MGWQGCVPSRGCMVEFIPLLFLHSRGCLLFLSSGSPSLWLLLPSPHCLPWPWPLQFSSVAQSYPTLWDPMDCSMPGFLSIISSQSLLKLKPMELVMPPNHLILCRPLLLLPLIFPSIRIFSNESVLHIRWQNIGVSASASVLPMNIQDWFPLGLTGWIFLQSKGLSKNLPSYKGSCDCLEPIWVI